MSDDRMDRAERIRNMREGNRGTDEETADSDDTATDTTEAGKSTSERATGETDSSPSSDRATTSETESSPPADTTADATPTTESSAATQTESPVTTTSTAESADDDATAAAQRAAASAAEMMGDDGVSVDAEPAGDEPTVPDAEAGAAGGGLMGQGPTGVELPDQQLLEEAMENSTVTTTEGGARAASIEGETTQTEELVRVLEFSLGDEYYCLDIEYVEEIVKRSSVTRVPNTPEFVDGVVDLRGQITTILEPKEMMDIESEGDQNLIIVFDPDKFEEQGAVGWVVDEVRQVVPVTESEVNSPPVDAAYINGVVDREEYDQFVIWVEPDDALEQATSTDEE